jgi:hypothetical protein
VLDHDEEEEEEDDSEKEENARKRMEKLQRRKEKKARDRIWLEKRGVAMMRCGMEDPRLAKARRRRERKADLQMHFKRSNFKANFKDHLRNCGFTYQEEKEGPIPASMGIKKRRMHLQNPCTVLGPMCHVFSNFYLVLEILSY